MLGGRQEEWLHAGFENSAARWNILGGNVMMSQLLQKTATGDAAFWTDDWNGYPANRARLLRTVHESGLSNPVMLAGDIHSYWTNDVKLDFNDPNSPAIATEFVTTSITSNPPPHDVFVTYLPDNPHVKFFEARERGYTLIHMTPDRMTTRLRNISDRADPNATISTLKTFVVEDGRPGAVEM